MDTGVDGYREREREMIGRKRERQTERRTDG
jgi:hypothetical protein